MSQTVTTARPTRARFMIVGLLFVTTVINYLDRSSISIAAPFISSDLHLNSVEMGLVFSAFAWAYSPLQIPARCWSTASPRACSIRSAIFFWSSFQLLLGFASGLTHLFLLAPAASAPPKRRPSR